MPDFVVDILYFIFALLFGLVIGRPGIKYLKQQKLGQTIRKDGPQSHLKKSGTPTMGGFIFLLPTLIVALIIAITHLSLRHLPLVLLAAGTAALGFFDDRIKVHGDPEGLSVKAKSLGMVGLILLFVLYVVLWRPEPVLFGVPWLGWIEVQGGWLWLYGAFAFFYLYACINAVNITDGIDGLCTSVSLVTLIGIVVMLFIPGLVSMEASQIQPLRGTLLALIGGLIAFFHYNHHPAQVFMGDFGSLPLGALISGALLLMGLPLAFLTLGVIYWVEIGSVLIQVLYFRYTGGKRIFRMSPIHHHFELGGWSERKIVVSFSLVQLAGAGLTYLIFRSLWLS